MSDRPMTTLSGVRSSWLMLASHRVLPIALAGPARAQRAASRTH
jgi:hypothetical protein